MRHSRFRSRPQVPVTLVSLVAAICASSGLLSPAVVAGQAVPAESIDAHHAPAVSASRALLDSLLNATGIPGLSVAVAVDGDIVWSEGFGYADVENQLAVTPLTRFRIGSVSKTLTADAIGLLVERGQLDLDAPIQRYVPDFPEKRWPITTRQLGGHMAGVRHYRGGEFLAAEAYETVDAALEIFAGDSLMFEPGTQYSYSSYGWNLLSAVIEGASGESFLDFMQREVFDGLGMRHTHPDRVYALVPYRSRPYGRNAGGELVNSPFVDNSYKWAGGGFVSTMEDLVRFADSHLRGTLLDSGTVELLWTSQRTTDGEATDYGIGWRTGRDGSGRRVVRHGGGSVGGSTLLVFYPDDEVAVAMVANLTDAPLAESVAIRVAERFMR